MKVDPTPGLLASRRSKRSHGNSLSSWGVKCEKSRFHNLASLTCYSQVIITNKVLYLVERATAQSKTGVDRVNGVAEARPVFQ
jgi:hypothetical protein